MPEEKDEYNVLKEFIEGRIKIKSWDELNRKMAIIGLALGRILLILSEYKDLKSFDEYAIKKLEKLEKSE